MASRWVVNASPLIALCKIDHQSLLSKLTAEISIPRAVAAEIAAGPVDDPARRFLTDAPIVVTDVPLLAAAPVLRALAANGFRLRDDVIREALARSVDEVWP